MKIYWKEQKDKFHKLLNIRREEENENNSKIIKKDTSATSGMSLGKPNEVLTSTDLFTDKQKAKDKISVKESYKKAELDIGPDGLPKWIPVEDCITVDNCVENTVSFQEVYRQGKNLKNNFRQLLCVAFFYTFFHVLISNLELFHFV